MQVLEWLYQWFTSIVVVVVLLRFLVSMVQFFKRERREEGTSPRERASSRARTASDQGETRERIFLENLAGMMAKIAKADGRITSAEIETAETAFKELKLSHAQRGICIRAFRKALAENLSIAVYARRLSEAGCLMELRRLIYHILWSIATVDGHVHENELACLKLVAMEFMFSKETFDSFHRAYQANEAHREDSSRAHRAREPQSKLDEAYALLNVSPRASNEEVRQAYRQKVKKLHPDLLLAQGLPKEMLPRANELMAEVNEAWDIIKNARGL